MISGYVVYRWQLFVYEIKHWLAQLSSMMLFLVMILGSAIPVLFYLALIGFGMLVEKNMAVNDAMLFVASVCLFQSVILDVCKSAIRGTRFTEFNRCLPPKNWLTYGCDCGLVMLCNPLVLLNLLLIFAVGVAHWAELQHMLLFLLLQIVLTRMIFSSALRAYLLITCCFLLSYIPLFTEIETALVVFLLLATGLMFLPSIKLNRPLRRYSAWWFWFDFWRENMRAPLLVMAVSILILYGANGFVQQRPDLSNIVFLVTGQLLILVVSGLQVELNKLQADHSEFYDLYQSVASFYWIKNGFLVGAGVLILVLFGLVSGKPAYGLLPFFMLLGCFWVARHKPAYLVYSWLLSCVCLALLQYFVMFR